ncbi:hypothetical protein HWB90_gp016 [Mycobacterium phage Fowlmouth]|uniref:Uncharacterized protein n=1 Tax=Mycobacterium phage Fowlmouth TaxID=2419978 RepID=A0A3G2KG55_9CAUD|nr:hypothetical protein HWB90_gp016 [Mycobacterium phage Fowlmouth]AYN57966.1 hypothetical protein SEA_FOWLMOUTH_16 [Mycobacterium phage Fowlmouth]
MSDTPGIFSSDEPAKPKEDQDPLKGLPPTVRVEEARTPMALKQPDKSARGPWVQYNGVGTVRIMTAADWKTVGVDSKKYCEWNYLNHKRLPVSSFTDEELQYLLRVDGRFSVVEDEN